MARSRFNYTGSRAHLPRIPAFLRAALSIAVVLLVFLYAVHRFGSYTDDKQAESLENALRRNIVQCYALEGVYPPDAEYLAAHYGLIYDRERFYIDYRPLGSNLYPDVTVIDKKAVSR